MGDRIINIEKTKNLTLFHKMNILKSSSFYETPSWPNTKLPKYLNIVLKRIEDISGEKISDNIMFKKSFCVKDFMDDYNSYKGNAYGLANTLFQTSIFKPKMKSKKIKGLYFTGQLTVPGPGVPPSLISGKIVSDVVMQDFLY